MASFTMLWNGAGNPFNHERGHTSFTLSGGGANVLLVDCGGTVPQRLVETGELTKVTDILLTHMHGDHIGGLEALAFHALYLQGRRGADKLRLHVATDEFAHRLWEHSLKGGMEPIMDADLKAHSGTLETFFEVRVAKLLAIEGLPPVEFRPTLHIAGLENYAMMIDGRVYFSGDTVERPSVECETLFHDCEFRDPKSPGVHISYDELLDALTEKQRATTWLTHVGPDFQNRRPTEDGFAGVVEPYQSFEF